MIGRLVGTVVSGDGTRSAAAASADGAVVVDVGGVGYEVFVPLGTVGRAAVDAAGRATLWVHTHVREEALTLFGFATEVDRLAFRTLIGVSNVGPKTAIAVLSALPAGELGRAIAHKDVARLTAIPGIGRKTAERLVLELRDKITLTAAEAAGSPRAVPAAANGAQSERSTARSKDLVLSALTHMGYRPVEAERAVAALGERVDQEPLADLVREALAALAK